MSSLVVDIGVLLNRVFETFDFLVIFFYANTNFTLLNNLEYMVKYVNCVY